MLWSREGTNKAAETVKHTTWLHVTDANKHNNHCITLLSCCSYYEKVKSKQQIIHSTTWTELKCYRTIRYGIQAHTHTQTIIMSHCYQTWDVKWLHCWNLLQRISRWLYKYQVCKYQVHIILIINKMIITTMTAMMLHDSKKQSIHY